LQNGKDTTIRILLGNSGLSLGLSTLFRLLIPYQAKHLDPVLSLLFKIVRVEKATIQGIPEIWFLNFVLCIIGST
jgi:hypothetical protein